MPSGSKLAKHFISLSAAEFITRGLQAILSLYVARLLGVGIYGQIGFATAVTSYFAVLSDFGLTTLGIRDLAANKSVTNRYFSNILTLQLLLSLVLLALVGIFLHFTDFSQQQNWLIILYALSLVPSALNITYILQAYEHMNQVAIARVISQTLIVLSVLVGVWFWRNPLVVPLAQLIGGIVGTSSIALMVSHFVDLGWERVTVASLRYFSRLAMPFVTTAFFIQIYFNIDAVLLKFWRGDAEVGYYSAAYKVVSLVLIAASLVVSLQLPRMAVLWHENKDKFFDLIQTTTRLLALFIFPLAIIGMTYSKQIVTLLYGESYLAAWIPLFIMFGYLLLKFLSVFLDAPLVAIGRQSDVSVAMVGAALINLLLNVILIPRYGMIAAAVITVVSELIALTYLLICFYKHTSRLFIWDYIKYPLICSVPLLLWLIVGYHAYWIISAMIGILIYSAAVWFMGGLGTHERMLVRNLLFKARQV